MSDPILDQIDEIIKAMRPRWCGSILSMDGKYPCWIVWLPHEGSTTRKTLKQAILDFVEQAGDNHSTPARNE